MHATYIALMNTNSGTCKREHLWVKESMLLYGPDSTSAKPLTGVDYMLLRIETRKERDDWEALTSIKEPFDKAMMALGESGNPRVEDADIYIRSAVVAAVNSPDLTTQDKLRVARAIHDLYQKYKGIILGKRWGRTAVPDFNTVGTIARKLDTSPVTVGELFKE